MCSYHTNTERYKTDYTHDKLGRISQKIETLDGNTNTDDYRYDLADRLIEVKHNGTVLASYGYDANGNRTDINATPIATYCCKGMSVII